MVDGEEKVKGTEVPDNGGQELPASVAVDVDGLINTIGEGVAVCVASLDKQEMEMG